MSGDRMRRVNEAMRQVLGEVLAQDLKDPRVGFVTVTDVKTSSDLRYARVYVSVLGDEAAQEASLDGLRSAHGYLQSRVAGELRLKRTPELTFDLDQTAERAARLEALIHEVVSDKAAPAEAAPAEAASDETAPVREDGPCP